MVPLVGEFDMSIVEPVESFITAMLEGDGPVVVDLSEARYIDSCILDLLARTKRRAGDRLSLVLPKSSKLRRVFEITGLDATLEVAESLSQAIGQLRDRNVTEST